MTIINEIESRFKEVTGLTHLDLSVPHFQKGDNQQQKTSKSDYRNFGFVTTPLWLVDEMLEPQMPNVTFDSKTCDACSGCGQFSIRLMRKLYDKYVKMGVDPHKAELVVTQYWLKKNHYFTEFQFSNVAKLVYVFGPDINVYAGDSLNIKYAGEGESGLLFFNGKTRKWENRPGLYSNVVERKDDLTGLVELFRGLEEDGKCILSKNTPFVA